MALLGDDGEKFGVWPNTYAQVYENGWLDRFFGLLEANRSGSDSRLPAEVLGTAPAPGQGLPADRVLQRDDGVGDAPRSQRRFHALPRALARAGDRADARFVRGGFWRNFFARYPESRTIMHKRMLWCAAVERIDDHARAAREQAMDHLWPAQCNCAYWHGVFGGLYLPHLRDGALPAHPRGGAGGSTARDTGDAALDRGRAGRFRLRRRPRGVPLATRITLADGAGGGRGAGDELNTSAAGAISRNGLSRRPEAYHDALRAAADSGPGTGVSGGAVKSIHDRVEMKEPDLDRKLFYDWYRRLSLLDHFLRDETTLEQFDQAAYGEQGDFVDQPYEAVLESTPGQARLRLGRDGQVWVEGEAVPVRVEKQLRLDADAAEATVDYRITHGGAAAATLWFGVEFNFTLLAGQAPDRWVTVDDRIPEAEPHFAGRGQHAGASRIAWHDDWEKLSLTLAWDRPADLWRLPVETISQSESGFERVYQSSCALPHWRIALAPGQSWTVSFTLGLAPRD